MVGAFFKRYVASVRDTKHGESYTTIMKYVLPEMVSALILSSILTIIDAFFVANLRSTSLYAAQGLGSTFMLLVSKIIEGLSVGTVIMVGFYNGRKEYANAGRVCVTSLWVALVIGICFSSFIFLGASSLYAFYGVSPKIALAGTQYLRVRVVGIFFQCIFASLIGFLRGIKNTRTPMSFYVMGAGIFILFDYLLIFGFGSIPAFGLIGSAWASAIQYGCMALGVFLYVIVHPSLKAYNIKFLSKFTGGLSLRILWLSAPVVVDKAVLAYAKIWLVLLITPMGKIAIASFTAIKDLEQFAFVPAMACAQVITFLVSNHYGINDWVGIKNSIKKVLLLAIVMVMSILAIFSCASHFFIGLFDPKHVFVNFAATVFPFISLFVFFDVLQLILAAALRGASKVQTVMIVRALVCGLFFLPYSFGVSKLPLSSALFQFVMIYTSFYLADALMGFVYGLYIVRFSKKQELKEKILSVHE
ncbi:MAG: hypothetical protein UU47_C0017G0014 [candidate division TM6 bacterium GW2011_GWE2_41_16]|nr:MAG: hypothetical protein UU47_C0017G0014 [candidate division TM6 bacterium GW2011_GWE2_41_16]